MTDERGQPQDQQLVGVVEARGIIDGESLSQSSLDLAEVLLIIEPLHEKTNILVSDLVRHKPGCKATEDG